MNFFYSHRLALAEAAARKGFKVVIGYGELGNADPDLLKYKGFTTQHIPMQRSGINIINELKTLSYIWKFFSNEKPDIVHLVTIKPYLYGGIISRLLSIPSLVSAVSGLGTLFINNNLKNNLLRLLLYPLFKLAFSHPNQKIIFQNKDDVKVFARWGVLNSSKVELIRGSGVNLKNFTDLVEPKGVPIVCFAARLIRDKGVYEFISAAQILKSRSVKAFFYLAGDLDLQNPTGLNVNDLNKLKEESCVKFIGYHTNISKLYADSHIVCLPSYREGLPKSLIEAAAAGRAVVTTDVPGCRDAIIVNKTGLIVPVKNSYRLADAIQWLIEHPSERIKMGKAGRKYAEKNFKIEKIIQYHLSIYRELINNLNS